MPSDLDPRREFALRRKVREKAREAYIENCGDPEKSQRQAERECKSLVGSLVLAIIINLMSQWIADFIRDWLNKGIKIPSHAYHNGEPGYDAKLEDSWEDES